MPSARKCKRMLSDPMLVKAAVYFNCSMFSTTVSVTVKTNLPGSPTGTAISDPFEIANSVGLPFTASLHFATKTCKSPTFSVRHAALFGSIWQILNWKLCSIQISPYALAIFSNATTVTHTDLWFEKKASALLASTTPSLQNHFWQFGDRG